MADGSQAGKASGDEHHRMGRHWLVVAGLLLGLTVMILVALGSGRYPVPIGEVVDLLWRSVLFPGTMSHQVHETVLFHVRLPRILAALIVGSALASAGGCYQSIFRNP